MADDTQQSIFISHTHSDQAIADAFRGAMRTIFGERVTVRYSTNKELEGGIKPGEDWFRWIGEQVRAAKAALIILTPSSVQKPWVLWEAGAVAGAVLASAENGARSLIPISYRLKGADIPTVFGRDQITDGLDEEDVERLLESLLNKLGNGVDNATLVRMAKAIEPATKAYIREATEACRTAPLLVTEAAVQEWLERIAALENEGRFSEVEELHDWLSLAFGRARDTAERPLDLRIHRRLGELYSRANMAERAAYEFDLARQLAPRDVYVLRKLGKAYLDQKRFVDAGNVIKTIEELDSKAFVRNAENAALKARWHRERGATNEAAEVLKAAFDQNHRSYYLADLLGQAQLAAGQIDEARQTYRQVLRLVNGLRDRNIWVVTTGFTAALVTDEKTQQKEFLETLSKMQATDGQVASMRRGIGEVVQAIGVNPSILKEFDSAVKTRA